MQRTLIINRQFVKTNTCFPLFSYTFFPFSPPTHPIFGRFWGKMGLGLLVSYTFFNPQIQISARFGENGLGHNPVEYPFVTACVFGP